MDRWGCRDCRALYGAWLSRCPRCGSTEELVMALNKCTGCTTKFAVGLPKCPHCGSTEYVEDGAMAKIGRHMGASDKTLPVPDTEPERAEAAAPEPMDVTADLAGPARPVEVGGEDGPELVETEGGEESSPGSSSSASTEKPPTTSEPSEAPSPKRARTTASRSRKGQTDSSSATSTDGDQTEATSAADRSE